MFFLTDCRQVQAELHLNSTVQNTPNSIEHVYAVQDGTTRRYSIAKGTE